MTAKLSLTSTSPASPASAPTKKSNQVDLSALGRFIRGAADSQPEPVSKPVSARPNPIATQTDLGTRLASQSGLAPTRALPASGSTWRWTAAESASTSSDGLLEDVVEKVTEVVQMDPRSTGFGAIKNLIEKWNKNRDTIAVFDNFGDDQDPDDSHGDDVSFVVDANGQVSEAQIRRFETNGGSSWNEDESLEDFLAERGTGLLNATSDNLETILDKPGKVTVINQSQSVSEIRVVDDLYRSMGNDPALRSRVLDELGLPDDASEKEVLEGLVQTADFGFENNRDLREARQRYQQLSVDLDNQGILHVVTAGNTGRFLEKLESLGIETDSNFTESVLFTPDKIVVAASTGATHEEIADFSTPSAFVTVAIDGTDIPVVSGTSSGTSHAAPQVTALIDDLRRINPDLSNAQIRQILARAGTSTGAGRELEGSGVLDPEEARRLAAAA
jgi:hypothetical protein